MSGRISRSTSPSDGEILESTSEKANTIITTTKEASVDPHSRERASTPLSIIPTETPGAVYSRSRSRDRSRSPYRESTGSKRRHIYDHYRQSQHDNRRFKTHYETARERNRHRDYAASRDDGLPTTLTQQKLHDQYDSTNSFRRLAHSHNERPPPQFKPTPNHNHRDANRAQLPILNQEQDQYQTLSRRPEHNSSKQSVSIQSQTSLPREDCLNYRNEYGEEQSTHSDIVANGLGFHERQRYEVPSTQNDFQPKVLSKHVRNIDGDADLDGTLNEPVVDEVSLINERRKRRQAIMAKHGDNTFTPTPIANLDSQVSRRCSASPEGDNKIVPPDVSSTSGSSGGQVPFQLPRSPPELSHEGSIGLPTDTMSSDFTLGEDPSAADYDPMMDMQKTKFHQDPSVLPRQSISKGLGRSPDAVKPEVVSASIESTKDVSGGFDMFADGEDMDMFAEDRAPALQAEHQAFEPESILKAQAIGMGMLDDWDDADGYYKVKLGELLNGRYHVQSNLGKGMFSGVVRASDQEKGQIVAIKLVRNNETMHKAGLKEIAILQTIRSADPEDRKHLIRLERHFEHKGHLCMVFENLSINLREVLKKFGRDVGINLKAVRIYAQQMFLGLSLLRKCNILHADLKPDNVLVNESRNVLKICDLGSASDASENEITQYLVSRFYRAPEIILGCPYDFAIDMWSVGCTLFELYTGKILFTGRTNNQMLKVMMDCRGKFGQKMLRRGQYTGYHFDDLLNFRSVEKDRLSGKDVIRLTNVTKPTRDLKSRLLPSSKGASEAEMKEIYHFADLLDRCLNLNPEKRCTPQEALKHPFITRQKA